MLSKCYGQSKIKSFLVFFNAAVERGLLLFTSTLFAILIANSKFSNLYYSFIEKHFQLAFKDNYFSLTTHEWINQFLMSIFFLVVGMEIKRETINGHLKDKSQRILPIVAACFGVLLPVAIYTAFNYEDKVSMRTWAAPAATDIAFALAVFSVIGKRLPPTLKTFLTALAVIDDLIAVIIIALFYSGSLKLSYFIPIIICCIVLYLLNKLRIAILQPYLVIGLIMWYLFFKSGVHPTISGVVLGIFIPLQVSNHNSPLQSI